MDRRDKAFSLISLLDLGAEPSNELHRGVDRVIRDPLLDAERTPVSAFAGANEAQTSE